MREKINIKKVILTSIIISVIQGAAIIAIIIWNNINRGHKELHWSLEIGDFVLLFVVISVIISCFFTIKNLYSISFIDNEQGMLKSTLGELEELNRTLRSQRHDFINHLQVVYSLMEMNEYVESRDYIEKVYDDIQKVNKVLKTANPAVNALLQAKVIYCEKKNIEVKINITTQLSGLIVPSWEFCRILGNIMDNAIFALENIDKVKLLNIEIHENIKYFGFMIGNNGPKIPNQIIEKIFVPGFTTKGENGQGMGLSIVKEIIERYKGSILVKSDAEYTFFEGKIPK